MKRGVSLVAIATLVVALAVGAAVGRSRHTSSAPPRLPSGFAGQMGAMGLTYSDVTGVTDEVRSRALHAASHGASPMVGHDTRPIVVQVRFTDNVYRDHGRRLYTDRRALMLIYPKTPIPLSGPVGFPGGTVDSTLVDFLDPTSFGYLGAVSFNTTTHVDQTG